jgi:hypothetical protein
LEKKLATSGRSGWEEVTGYDTVEIENLSLSLFGKGH